ncbi:MAG: hypothetical protein HYS13_18315 [Planctomycetia bacterium]|nr:hypothetical protein [Planctomycetia bacterium]
MTTIRAFLLGRIEQAVHGSLVRGLDRATAEIWARSFNRAERERPYGVKAEVRPRPSASALHITASALAPLERSA